MRKKILFAIFFISLLAVSGCSHESQQDNITKNDSIKIALDWSANTNYSGLYIAQELGYFKEEKISVDILPYAGTSSNILLDNKKANLAFSFHESSLIASANGSNAETILSITQKTNSAIAVLENRKDIQSPKDLEGKTYAGFGDVIEDLIINTVLHEDSGETLKYEKIIAGTSLSEALHSEKVDFIISIKTWDAIAANITGKKYKYFEYEDYGFPKTYGSVINADNEWAKNNKEKLIKVTNALGKGYRYTIENPEKAAQIMINNVPELKDSKELVTKSLQLMAEEYMLTENKQFGCIDNKKWYELGDFLEKNSEIKISVKNDSWKTRINNVYCK